MRINFASRLGKLVEVTEETVQENVDLFKKKIEYPNTPKEIKRFMKNMTLGRYHYISFAVTTGYKSLDYQDTTDNLAYTALHIASARGYPEEVNELLKYKADANIRNAVGDLPIHLAWNFWRQPCESKEARLEQEKKTTEVVHFLLKWGAFVNSTTSDTGDTPLHFACRLGPLAVVNVLLGFKGDHLLPNKAGATPVDVAAENGNEDILNVLNCWSGVRSQLVNADFIVQWKAFLSDYDAVISKGKDVETVIFEMNMRENIRKQEILLGAKFQVDDPLLIRAKNEAVMHQKLTSRQAALKAAEEAEAEEFHTDDCGQTVSSEGLALGPKGTSMYSADVPDWMGLMGVPVRKKKKKKGDLGNPVDAYYNTLVEKNRPKDSQIIRDKYITAHKKREEREKKVESEAADPDPFGDFVKQQYQEKEKEEAPRPSTKLRDRRLARARAVKLDAKFEMFTKRPCTSSPMFISQRTANAPLKGTEEETSLIRYFSTPTRTRNLVVAAIEDRKKMGVRQYGISNSQQLSALGSYAKETDCLADPSGRQLLYDRLLDENDERSKLAKQNRAELNKMLESGKTDSWRGKKVDMVPNEKRMRFVSKELVPPNREISALDELKGKIKRDQDKLGISNKKNDKDVEDKGMSSPSKDVIDNNDADNKAEDDNGDKEDESQVSDFDKKFQELQEKNAKKGVRSKITYGKGRLTSTHQMKQPLAKPWGNVRANHQLKTII
jgi:hypothetical protein